MADEPQETQGAEQREEPDYKALYEQMKATSRKWEERAKANKSAADELGRVREAGKTAEEQLADLKRRLDEKERDEERRRSATKVARKKGVPAELLAGDTEEEMEAWADAMLAHFKPKAAPKVEAPGKFDREASGGTARDDFSKFMSDIFN